MNIRYQNENQPSGQTVLFYRRSGQGVRREHLVNPLLGAGIPHQSSEKKQKRKPLFHAGRHQKSSDDLSFGEGKRLHFGWCQNCPHHQHQNLGNHHYYRPFRVYKSRTPQAKKLSKRLSQKYF